jgi:hypothetical protein
VVSVHHKGQAVYAMPPVALAVALAGAALAVVGAAGMVAVRRHDAALLVAVVATLMTMGVLSLFSVGLLFLLAGLAIAVALARRLSGSGVAAVASGLAMTVGLAAAGLVAIQPPVVECLENGTRSSSSIWSGTGSSSGSTRSGPGGSSAGTVTHGSKTYSFTCRDGRLIGFRSSPSGADAT